jgi:hypothetical protein
MLGARVLGRHHRERGGGGRHVGVDAGGEQLGDAEVEQLRDAVTVHQDVRRLDVAVDHQVLMGVVDGAAHRPEQGQPLPGPQLVRRAEMRDRLPVHVLHHEVGLAGLGRPAVEHRRDVGMLEAREDLSLLAEAPLEGAGVDPAADQLQGDGLAERVVVPHGPVDRAHASVRDRVEGLVGPDPLRAGLGRAGPFGAGDVEPDRSRQEAAGLLVRDQQAVDLAAQLVVAAAGLVEEDAPRLRRARERGLEHFLQSLPTRARQLDPSLGNARERVGQPRDLRPASAVKRRKQVRSKR